MSDDLAADLSRAFAARGQPPSVEHVVRLPSGALPGFWRTIGARRYTDAERDLSLGIGSSAAGAG